MLVPDLLRETARQRPDSPALISRDQQLSYRELDEASDRLAAAFQLYGIERGQRVATVIENSVEFVVTLWGTLKAGAVFVPVHHATRLETLTYILNDADVSCLVIQSSFRKRAGEISALSPASMKIIWTGSIENHETCLNDIMNRPAAKPVPARIIDQDLSLLIYTSGSTGTPKGVMMTHHAVSNNASVICSYLKATPDDVVLGILPMSFSYGLFQVLTAACAGFSLVLERSFAFPVEVLKTIARHRITGLPSVPGLLVRLLDMAPFDGYDLSQLRYITNAAAPLPPAHIDRLRTLLPQVEVYSMYGLTECTRVSYLNPARLGSKTASVGTAIPNCEVLIIDERGEPCQPGDVGELAVRGSNIMRGYWRRPEDTARVLRVDPATGDRLLLTGDLFYTDEDGDLFFVGRRDDVFKCRGEKVSPREVENVLHEYDGIAEAAIIGIPDPVDGLAVKAFVVLHEGHEASSDAIRRYCMTKLPNWMVPKHIEFCQALPKTESGKVTRKALREMAFAENHGDGTCAA